MKKKDHTYETHIHFEFDVTVKISSNSKCVSYGGEGKKNSWIWL